MTDSQHRASIALHTNQPPQKVTPKDEHVSGEIYSQLSIEQDNPLHTERGLLSEEEKSNNIFFSVNKYFGGHLTANIKSQGQDAQLEASQVGNDGLSIQTKQLGSLQMDPCEGLSFIEQVAKFDSLKDIYTPFDVSSYVQILKHPTEAKSFISVQNVKQNVLHSSRTRKKEPEFMTCQNCQQELQLFKVKNNEQQEQNACFLCNRQSETQYYKCSDKKKSQSRESQSKQNRRKQESTPAAEEALTKKQLCEKTVCCSCFADNHLRRLHQKKTSQHYFFEMSDGSKLKDDEIPQSEDIAVIGIWEIDQSGRPKCQQEYFMDNPLYFPRNYGKDSEEILENVFIHQDERSQLYVFQRLGKNIKLQTLVFEKNNQDPYKTSSFCRVQTKDAKFYIIKHEANKEWMDQTFGASSIFTPLSQAMPRMINSCLVVQNNNQQAKKQFNDSQNLICYDLASETYKKIEFGLLFLGSLYLADQKEQPDHVYLLCSHFKIHCVSWSLFMHQDFTILKSADQYSAVEQQMQPKFIQELPIQNLADILKAADLQSVIFNKGQSCTILSQSERKWLTFDLKQTETLSLSKMLSRKITAAKELNLMKEQNDKKISWLCSNDECYIIQGLTKISQKNLNLQSTYLLEVINQSRQNDISQIEIYVPTEVIFKDEVNVFNVKPLVTTQENGKLKFVCAIFYTDPLTQETVIGINSSQASNQQQKVCMKTSRLIFQNQQHYTQFPILCQNTFHPRNNRIIFTNLVKNCNKQVVQLPAGFIFVKFVQEAAQFNRGKKSTDPVDDFGKVQIFVLAQEQSTCAYHLLLFETQPFYDCINSEGSQKQIFKVSYQLNKLNFKSFLLHEPSQNMNPIKFAFVNQIRQKKQTKYLLVLQTSSKIWFYLDGVLQMPDKALPRTAPVPMIQGICNTYFYVGRDEIGTDCVVGIQIPTSNKNQTLKPIFKILHQQQPKIVQLNCDEARSNLGSGEGVFLHIDEEGIIKEYFYSLISNDLQLKSGIQTQQYQTFKVKEYRVGIMENIVNCAWKSHIFSDEVIYSFQKGRLLEYMTQTQQLQVQADQLKVNMKQFKHKNDYSEQVTYTQQVASIDRYLFAYKTEGRGGYIFIKPIPKSTQINFISNISSQFCSNAHFTKDDVMLEVNNQQSTKWIQFSSTTLMIENVIQFTDKKPSIIYASSPWKKKYIIKEDDHSLYDYQDQKDKIYPQLNRLIEREDDLLQKIQDYDKNRNFNEIESVKILMEEPVLTQSGQSIIVSLLSPNQYYQKPKLDQDKTLDAVANESLVRIKKLTTNVLQPFVRNQTKENLEHHIEPDVLSQVPQVTVNYLVIEKIEEEIDQDFVMQVVLTKNYLVWTTPSFVNFAKLKDIDDDQQSGQSDQSLKRQQTDFVTSKENQQVLKKVKKVINARLLTQLATTSQINSDGVQQYQNKLSTQLGEILKERILNQIELQKNIKNFVKNIFQQQGVIRKQIALTNIFTAQEIKNLKIFALSDNDKEFVARDSQEANDGNSGEKSNKSRQDLLQIRTKKISAIWDLEQCEEITYLAGWKQIAQQPIRTGHILQYNEYEILQNQKSDLFIERGTEGEIKIERLYSQSGIRFLQYAQHMLKHKQKLAYENIYFPVLTQNIMGRSLLSLFHEHYQLIDYCRAYLETLDKESTVVTESSGHFLEYDQILLRRFYHVLLLPVIIGNDGLELSELAQKFQLQRRKSQKVDASTVSQSGTSQQKKNSQMQNQIAFKQRNQVIQTILHYSLHEDKLLFNYLCKMITFCKESRLSNFVTTFEDFEKFFGTRTATVDQFMQKAYIRTEFTQKIKVLWALPDQGHLYFQSNSPLLNDEQIENGFLNSKQDDKLHQTQLKMLSKLGVENQEELVPFEVEILEIEWLEDKNQEFMISITNHDDETVYDDPLIKFFLGEVNYKTRIILYVFIPYLIYAICVILYFTFSLTIEGGSGIGYFKGNSGDIALRTIILILGLYFAFLECWSMFTDPSSYLKSLRNYIYWIHLLLNQYIITEDSTYFTRRTGLEVSRIASVMIIIIWIYLYFWLRIFQPTAIYVQMINSTIYDIKEYMLVFIMCCLMFGNGILVLDNYMLQYDTAKEIYGENTYNPIIMKLTGGRYFDAFVEQYQTVMGAFDTSGYNQQNEGLLWIYFFGTTFITNIMILNMLIAIMAQTYETVSEHRERNTLIMSTNIQTDYIFLLGQKQIFGQYRYLYLARPIIEGENKSFDIQSSVKKLQSQLEESNLSQIESSQKMLLELTQLKQQFLTLQQKMEESTVFTDDERLEIKKLLGQKKSQEDQSDVGEQLKVLKKQQDDLNLNVLKILSQLRTGNAVGTDEIILENK